MADNPEEDIPEEERRQGDNPEARLVAPSCPAADSPEERPQQARQREVEHQLEHQLPGQLEWNNISTKTTGGNLFSNYFVS